MEPQQQFLIDFGTAQCTDDSLMCANHGPTKASFSAESTRQTDHLLHVSALLT